MARPPSPFWHSATADLRGLDPALLQGAGRLEELLGRVLGAPHVAWSRHEFSPQGVSVVGVSPHVRVVLHTWPESGASTLDVWSADENPVSIVELAATELYREGRGSVERSSADASHELAK